MVARKVKTTNKGKTFLAKDIKLLTYISENFFIKEPVEARKRDHLP